MTGPLSGTVLVVKRGCGILAPVVTCTGVWYMRVTAVCLASVKSDVTLYLHLGVESLVRILMLIHAVEGAENAHCLSEFSGIANFHSFLWILF